VPLNPVAVGAQHLVPADNSAQNVFDDEPIEHHTFACRATVFGTISVNVVNLKTPIIGTAPRAVCVQPLARWIGAPSAQQINHPRM
jgi:hypothetical protein